MDPFNFDLIVKNENEWKMKSQKGYTFYIWEWQLEHMKTRRNKEEIN
jgi:hypothetical protein